MTALITTRMATCVICPMHGWDLAQQEINMFSPDFIYSVALSENSFSTIQNLW